MSSGYTTLDATVETVDRVVVTSVAADDLCVAVWDVPDGGSDDAKSCVQYQVNMERPMVAADATVDMTIYADPENTNSYATTYTFRGRFGPFDKRESTEYQCADQTIDFSAFYQDVANKAMYGLSLGAGFAAFASSILF